MKTSIFSASLALFMASATTQAHELKVLVSQYDLPSSPSQVTVYLSWGHHLPVDGLMAADTIDRYEVLTPDGKTIKLKSEGESLQANAVVLKDDGVYRAIAVRKPSALTYVLDDDGNKQMKLGGKTEHADAKIDSAFLSTQCSTALVVIGNAQKASVQPAGLPFEIVPLDSPSDWKSGKELRVRVLLNGKPMSGVELAVRALNAKADADWIPVGTTADDGDVTLPEAESNIWILKAQAEKPADEKDRQQFDVEKYTATLSVEIKE